MANACDQCPEDTDNDADQDYLCANEDSCPYGGAAIGSNGYPSDCSVCIPFAGPVTDAIWGGPPTDATSVGANPWAAFGSEVRVPITNRIDFVGPELLLPPGDWSLRWRVKGATTARDLTLDIATSGCAFTIPVVWQISDQPAAGTWAWSAPLAVAVNGTEPCRISPRLRNTVTAQLKVGYAFDHVRADLLCHTASDCPEVPGANAACTPDLVCAYWGDDEDADNVCNAVDVCTDGDDRNDLDFDRVPTDCDCDDADADVWPGADVTANGDDQDCNGLDDAIGTPGAWQHSVADYSVVWDEQFVLEQPTTESIFGVVDVTDSLLSWLDYFDGPVTYLDKGEYVLDFRFSTTAAGIETTTEVEAGSTRQCVTEASRLFNSTGTQGQWETTPLLAFEVTGDHCPVRTRLWSHDDLKANWRIDWSRIRHACAITADCPQLSDGTNGTCGGDGACVY